MYDAVVVGGGVVGAAVAYHLASAGADALLVDRNDPGKATDAGAGIVSPATSAYEDPSMHRFAVDAARYYPELVEDLEQVVDDAGFDRPGVLVAATEGEAAEFERFRERLSRNRERAGYPAPDALSEIEPEEAVDLFPALGDVSAALYYQDGGRVDGRTLNRALVRAGEAAGLDARDGNVDAILAESGTVSGVRVDGETVRTENAVVAGGAWSGAFADDLGVTVPVEPQRGQIAHFDASEDTTNWPLVKGFRDHYLVPWPDGSVAAGATRETESGFTPRTTAAGVREVLDEALRLAPGLADAELTEVRVGLRPRSADGLPVIGGAPLDGGYIATGHGPSGLTLGPYTGALVADLVLEGDTTADLSPFAPGRFD